MVRAVVPAPDGGYPGFNTAEGENALSSLTAGSSNTAVGWFSLFSNTDGSFNTAVGAGTLLFNIGDQSAGEGIQNTAIGTAALLNNASGGFNTATGVLALFHNNSGFDNTATGVESLLSNTTGQSNVAYGDFTLLNNITGSNNIAVGYQSLLNTTGSDNIALGAGAGSTLTTGDSNIDIDNPGVAGESNTIRIGNTNHTRTFIAGISGTAIASGAAVVVDSNGQLGVALSSRRFKRQIKPMDQTSETILALKPVTFHYKSDATDTPQFGLVAEEVEKVNPNLVLHDQEGKPYTVRYDAVNAMLLNEFLKEHKTVQEQGAMIAELKKAIVSLTENVKAQGAQIQRVNAQIQTNQPAAKVVLNNP
ncbi:MAG TPA: tail fiber domain-containing protein [Candidatus Udaeobacter sp.]|nr:tail fiber domain-containing protein [Candidatus Udaeobacter sp.]